MVERANFVGDEGKVDLTKWIGLFRDARISDLISASGAESVKRCESISEKVMDELSDDILDYFDPAEGCLMEAEDRKSRNELEKVLLEGTRSIVVNRCMVMAAERDCERFVKKMINLGVEAFDGDDDEGSDNEDDENDNESSDDDEDDSDYSEGSYSLTMGEFGIGLYANDDSSSSESGSY